MNYEARNPNVTLCHLLCRQQRSRVLRLISRGRYKTKALEIKAGNRERPSSTAEVSQHGPAVRLVGATQAPIIWKRSVKDKCTCFGL